MGAESATRAQHYSVTRRRGLWSSTPGKTFARKSHASVVCLPCMHESLPCNCCPTFAGQPALSSSPRLLPLSTDRIQPQGIVPHHFLLALQGHVREGKDFL